MHRDLPREGEGRVCAYSYGGALSAGRGKAGDDQTPVLSKYVETAERAILAAFSIHRSVKDSSSMSFQVLPPSGHAQRFPGESLIWMQTWSHLSLPTDLRVEETVDIKQ